MDIDWSKQHCGVKKAPFNEVIKLMPDLIPILESFPDDHLNFTWDIKVHMLMPRQYPCIPHWHCDNIPRENGIQRFEKSNPEFPMYLWISGAPLTQFRNGYIQPKKWVKFNQLDEHRGTAADDFCWRCFIRATDKNIYAPCDIPGYDFQRRHSQVYLDEDTYQW